MSNRQLDRFASWTRLIGGGCVLGVALVGIVTGFLGIDTTEAIDWASAALGGIGAAVAIKTLHLVG
ncbi:hypothetical protein [Caenispirillum bisanense]|uniref:hypothetical protein n=1 Tax=Caenispirillum bisanense TaxID=414052 RepID=UPI0031CDBA9B